VPHLNKSLARSNKNPFYQGFLTGIATINLREFFRVYSLLFGLNNVKMCIKVD